MSITVEIDGVQTEAAAGTRVLEAARALGDTIPALCIDEPQAPVGACRVRLVGVDGVSGPAVGALHAVA